MKKENLKKLTVSAIFIALSTVLSMVKIWQMPLGGSITLFSMLPICLIGVMYGMKYAILPCFLYGCLQTFLGGVFGWGLTPAVLISCIMLDYVLAYTCMCFSGLFRDKGTVGIIASFVAAMVGRFICHFVSGAVLFKTFDVFGNPYIYSLCYNGGYMLPELVITTIGAILLVKSGVLKKLSK